MYLLDEHGDKKDITVLQVPLLDLFSLVLD
jgi:hypothetical protein